MRSEIEKRFLSLISYGKENGTSMKWIANVLGIDNRAVRQIAQDLRENGVPVCGDKAGYYLAETIEEQRDAVQKWTIKARTAQRSLATHLEALGRMNSNAGE